MKNIQTTLFLALFILVSIVFTTSVFAQDPPPPPGGGHGGGGALPPGGGGAPVGEGLLILTALGAGYGGKKWVATKKQKITG
jgi:hypothetical protein